MSTGVQRLDAGPSTLLIAVRDGTPQLLYLGHRLDPAVDAAPLLDTLQAAVVHGELQRAPELPLYPGDAGLPGLQPALAVSVDGAARRACHHHGHGRGLDLRHNIEQLNQSLSRARRPLHVAPNLAPAYDLVSTIAFMPEDKLALTFGHSKAWEAINTDEIRYFAGKAELPETILVETAKETVQRFLEVWGRNQNHLALTSEMVQVVEQHIIKVPLVEEVR